MIDLHCHLYGSLTAEMLWKMGNNNPNPRWEIFTKLYEDLYNQKFEVNNFFQKYNSPEKLGELYYFRKKAPFLEFQCKFNLIIALSRFDPEEIQEYSSLIAEEHFKQGIKYIEYRIMYSPNAKKEDYVNKTIAACKGLQNAENSFKTHEARLVVSLHRNGNFDESYTYLKQLMKENELVKKYLVGIDFCSIEEGNPPKLKKEFFSKVNKDNQEEQDISLSILYHVGESFRDKTPDSAVRWILESAVYGAHRLGHCIALGIEPETYANQIIKESSEERLDQIHFILENYDTLREYGYKTEKKSLLQEKESLKQQGEIEIYYKTKEIENLKALQDFGMDFLAKRNVVIEVCPTSNLLIGMLAEEKLPIKRFLEKNLKVTIGTDDPGIFQTSLQKEYEICERIGIPKEKLNFIQNESLKYKSRKFIS